MNMEAMIKKHFWAVNLVFLALSAWLLAGGANEVIAHKLRGIPSLPKVRSHRGKGRRDQAKRQDGRVIVERNYFGSAVALPVETTEDGVGLDESRANELLGDYGSESELRATLVGTIVANDVKWSMAMITDQTSSETGAYRTGNRLMEEATILLILTDRVVINHNGNREYLMLQEKAQPKKKPGKKPRVAKGGKGGKGIKKLGNNKYSIERAEIDKTLSNLNSIAMQARIVPSFKDGKSNGFKLFAIRPGSLYSKLGIQNGDIVHKINGYAIDSPDKALEIYQKLKTARSVDVELTRRGKSQKMSYGIE